MIQILSNFRTMIKIILSSCSGKPLGFVNVFTAFGVAFFGLMISIGLFMIEMIAAKCGNAGCKEIMNAYNYRIDEESEPEPVKLEGGPFGYKAKFKEMQL